MPSNAKKPLIYRETFLFFSPGAQRSFLIIS
jgi:hypothetical protein